MNAAPTPQVEPAVNPSVLVKADLRAEAVEEMKSVRKLLRAGTLGKDLPELLNGIGRLTAEESQEVMRESLIMVNQGELPKSFGETVMMMALGRLAELQPGLAVQELARLNRTKLQGAAVILERVAAQDPMRAAALLAGELQDAVGQGSGSLAGELSGVWAEQDFEAASAWCAGLSGEMKGRALEGLVEAAYDRDPQGARDLLTAIEDPAIRGIAEGKLFNRMASRDPAAAFAFLNESGERSKDRERHRFLFKRWADTDLSDSLKGLAQISGEARQAAAESVVEVWAQSNPVKAAEWIASQPAGTTGFSTLNELTTAWGRRDPEAASRWVNELPPGQQREGAILGLVNSQQERDSVSAVAWAEQLADPKMRSRSLGTCYFIWRRTDAEAARRWLEGTHVLTDAQKEPLLQSR